MEKESREKNIDIFRGIGIYLMIMGHIDFGRNFDYYIHAFHMPMFFFISGMFFSIDEDLHLKEFIVKKIRNLLIPYVIFGLFHYQIWTYYNKEISLGPIKSLMWNNTEGLPIAGALWFLTALFFSNIIYFIIKKYIKIIIIALIGCMESYIFPKRLPYGLDIAFVGVGLMYLGELFQLNRECPVVKQLLNMECLKYILLKILSIVFIFSNSYINMRQGKYGIIPFFWLNILLSVFSGLRLSTYIEQFFPKIISKALVYCGKNSIVFVCLNQLPIYLMNRSMRIMSLNINVKRGVMLAITLLVLYIATYIIMNTQLKILIGKSKKFDAKYKRD